MSRSRTWVSLFVLLVIGLHALPVISFQGARQTRWPFLAWTMYARSYPAGPVQAKKRRLIGTTRSGAELVVNAEVVGLSGPAFGTTYIAPIYAGDTTVARELMSRVNRGRRDSLVTLRTAGEVYTVSGNGLRTDTLRVMTFRAAGPESR
jgi:hypothetical protein